MSTSEGSTDQTPSSRLANLRARLIDLGRRGGRGLGYAVLGVVSLLLIKAVADPYGALSLDPGVLIAMGLVGGGALILRSQEAPPTEHAQAVAHTPPRPRSPLVLLTMAAASSVVGLMILLGNLSVADLGIGQFVAAGLLVVGLGLLAGAWWGRGRLLIVVGLLMIPVVVVTGFIQTPLQGTVGGGYYTVQDISELEDHYEILVGSMTYDMGRMADFTGTRSIEFDVAAGNITLYVPEDLGLSINGHIEYGNATIGQGWESGEDIVLASEIEGKPGAGHLEIDFDGGVASFYVERFSRRELFGPRPPQRQKQTDRPVRERDGAKRPDEGGKRDREARTRDATP